MHGLGEGGEVSNRFDRTEVVFASRISQESTKAPEIFVGAFSPGAICVEIGSLIVYLPYIRQLRCGAGYLAYRGINDLDKRVLRFD